MPPAGGSGALRQYSFNYTMPDITAVYSRVTLIDKDGRRDYSNVVYTGTTNAITLYPNPASSSVVISGLAGKDTVQLFDNNGKMLMEQTAAGASKTILLQGLPQGLYRVKLVQYNQTIKVFKLIKE